MTTNSNQLPTEYKLGLHCPIKKNQKVESLKKREMIKLIAIYTWDNFTLTKSNLHLRTSHERVRQKNDHLRFFIGNELIDLLDTKQQPVLFTQFFKRSGQNIP